MPSLQPTKTPTPFLNHEDFFHNHWKKKPLYLPQAFPNFKSPLSEDELAGLACEKMIESRLILEHGTTPWELRHGPFKAKDFQKLPPTHWTLLVQAVNHWIPAVSDLLTHFNFLSTHYLDDIMISYATKHGGVGAHFDYYDVFILQGTGRRHWKLGDFCSPETPTHTETPLGILQEFNTREEFILEPGDLLYIPQQQAHWCVALEAGLSYSIGFRTPSHAELLSGFCNEVLSHLDESQRLQATPRSQAATPAQLSNETLATARQTLQNLLEKPQLLLDWFGRWVTEPKYPELANQSVRGKLPSLDAQLAKHKLLRHNESSRFAYYDAGESIYLFVDGGCEHYPAAMRDFIGLLCNYREVACTDLVTAIQDESCKQLLLSLVRRGVLYFC